MWVTEVQAGLGPRLRGDGLWVAVSQVGAERRSRYKIMNACDNQDFELLVVKIANS